jgi:hypothetical protein
VAKRIEGYYGQSGTGKSEAAASVIEQIFVEDGLKSRVIVGDGSKATYIDRGLVDAGIVEVVDFSVRKWPLTTAAKLTEGWWPKDVNDPDSPLVAPTPATLANLGVFVVEGLSVMGQYIMGDQLGGLAEQAARGIKIGENSPVRSTDILYDNKGLEIKDSGPGTVFGGNPMSHFGFAQRRLLANIERTKVFPNIVIWTAHEKGAKDKVSGETVVGMEAIGEAITANLSRHFNNTLHFVTASRKKDKAKDEHTEAMVIDLDSEFRIYTRDHYHPDGTMLVKYKAVTRGGIPPYDPKNAPDGMPLYLTSDVPGRSILEFYTKVGKAAKARAQALVAKREEKASAA